MKRTLLTNFFINRGKTVERPDSFEADAAARYSYALKYCRGKKVLDIGCGFGGGTEFIAKNGAKSVLGIDYDERVIKPISKTNRIRNLSFRKLDAFDLGKINEKFDVVLVFEIIEHLPVKRVREFIALVYERLVRGGIFFMTTPNGMKSVYFGNKLYNPYHTKEYKKEELEGLISYLFPKVEICGYKLANRRYQRKSLEIRKSIFHKPAYIIGHFKLARELSVFVPKRLRQFITKEGDLPKLTSRDYVITDNIDDSYGLIAKAQKKNIKQRPLFFSIVIANYNGEKYLENCLNSVLSSAYKNFEIIVCDDGSTDKSWNILKSYVSKHKRIKLIKNRANIGASASRNKAIKKAGGEIVVFLDNDTVVDKNWLKGFSFCFKEDLSVGAAQAVLLDLEKKDLIQHAGGSLAPQAGLLIPHLQWIKYKDVKKKITSRNIIGVSAALAVRSEVLRKVIFDEAESVHSEDIDFCWRVWISGYRVVLADRAFVYHLSKSVGDRGHMGASFYKIYFHLTKNSIRSFIKNYELRNIFKYFPQNVAINFARGILVLIKRRDFSALLATVAALMWNVKHLLDTIRARKVIQESRVFYDQYIFDNVFDKRNLIELYNQEFRQTKLLW